MSLLASGYSGGVSATMYWCLCTMQKLCNRKRQVAVSVPCPATGINHEVDKAEKFNELFNRHSFSNAMAHANTLAAHRSPLTVLSIASTVWAMFPGFKPAMETLELSAI